MPRAMVVGLRILALLALAAVAYGPLLGAGYRAQDLDHLLRGAGGGDVGEVTIVPLSKVSSRDLIKIDPEGSFLAGAELVAWSRLESWPSDPSHRVWTRLEGVLLLLAVAAGVGVYLRRLLLPWTGSEHAGAAAWSVVPLILVQPFGVALVAPLDGRDELWALALGAWAAAAFLKGRQDRRYGWTAVALGLTLVAAFGGELAWLLPALLAASEFASSHRYRTRRERLRTSANTMLFFGLAVAAPLTLWMKRGESNFGAGLAHLAADPSAALAALFERLGGLVLPANPEVAGLVGTVLAGAVFLVALQPALVAARSAPRLWGWMLCLWFVALLVTLVYGLDVDVVPARPGAGALLAGGIVVAAAGLATAATALSGFRRRWLAWIAAAVSAGLCCANAMPWRAAGDAVDELHADLGAARELYGLDARVLALDTPQRTQGVEPFGASISALGHPLVNGGAAAPPGGILRLDRRAFVALAREREFADLREERLVVLFPMEALPAGVPAASTPMRPGGRRQAVQLSPSTAEGQRREWVGSRSTGEGLDLDTLSIQGFELTANARTDTSGPRRIGWRVTQPLLTPGSLDCVWIETGDEPLLVADLGRSLTWILGERVMSMWVDEGGAGPQSRARLLTALEPLGDVVPAQDGEDWLFPRTPTRRVKATAQRGRYVLTLLSLRDYGFAELPVEVLGDDHLRATGAAARVRDMAQPVAWTLDYRVEDVTLSRASGRRVGRDGTREER